MAYKRIARIKRDTNETKIEMALSLDGDGRSEIATGIPFLDHMMTLFSRHGLFDMQLQARGDISVDYHHTVEDVGIVLGMAVKQAIGDKRGMRRYGFFILPMDETLARVVIDLSNRPMMVYHVTAEGSVRDFNLSLVREFFQGFANEAGANLHIAVEYGEEPHHVAEAIFKAFARALDMATQIDPRAAEALPTTKGLL